MNWFIARCARAQHLRACTYARMPAPRTATPRCCARRGRCATRAPILLFCYWYSYYYYLLLPCVLCVCLIVFLLLMTDIVIVLVLMILLCIIMLLGDPCWCCSPLLASLWAYLLPCSLLVFFACLVHCFPVHLRALLLPHTHITLLPWPVTFPVGWLSSPALHTVPFTLTHLILTLPFVFIYRTLHTPITPLQVNLSHLLLTTHTCLTLFTHTFYNLVLDGSCQCSSNYLQEKHKRGKKEEGKHTFPLFTTSPTVVVS